MDSPKQMRFVIYIILIFLYSCGYPDIDSVPDFNDLNLTDKELFDLCELSSADKSINNNCKKKNKKK